MDTTSSIHISQKKLFPENYSPPPSLKTGFSIKAYTGLESNHKPSIETAEYVTSSLFLFVFMKHFQLSFVVYFTIL
jgi:hypothetical protein